MTDNEKWYDENVAPELRRLASECHTKGMSFVAIVEYDKGDRGGTYFLTADAGLEMELVRKCALSGNNIDAYLISVIRYCKEHKVDISGSMFLGRFE